MSPTERLVSVIIPTYNCADYLPQAIESALAQVYPRIEIIIIDDGSTDATEEAIRPYRPRVTYLKQPNSGVSRARNLGISLAQGNYIALLDADDLWEPEKVADQVDLFESDAEVGLVLTDTRVINILTGRKHVISYDMKCITDPLPELARRCFPATSSVMIRKQCFDQVGGFDERLTYGEDWDLYARIARKYKFGYVPKAHNVYRFHTSNQMRNVNNLRLKRDNFFTVLDRIYCDPIWGEALGRLRSAVFHEITFDTGAAYFYAGLLADARAEFLLSLSYRPLHLRTLFYLLKTFLGNRNLALARQLRAHAVAG